MSRDKLFIPEMLTRASSLGKCTLFVLPFHKSKRVEMGLKGIEMK